MERIEVHIPSDLTFERVVRASTDEIGKVLEIPTDRLEDLKLAVSEAVCNAIEHGNQQMADKLVMVVFTVDTEKLEVHVIDQGTGVDIERLDFSEQHVEDAHIEGEGRRGFGMFLISALVDQYEVKSSEEGTTLTLRLYRKEIEP
ncbi:MAG: ATP-binding protein [Chloroflexaceae bacterium]|nr:ATP-binding protein [Chloroflexaceae bacterium]NJL32723.1 ATP-binding protein [Chloroflexaceae bacterium]NJO04168.1 ATP-binding protein [Chloroflexaceae bacterium]